MEHVCVMSDVVSALLIPLVGLYMAERCLKLHRDTQVQSSIVECTCIYVYTLFHCFMYEA